MRSVAYFVNWAIYGRGYNPQDLPADKLTHVLYAFANIRPETGEVYLTDSWSDVEKHYPGDSWNDSGSNVYGCIKQLALLKRKNRKMKLLLSIGGWTYSSNFAAPCSRPEGRAAFAASATRLILDLGFDGIDIDWEYPQDAGQAQNLVELLQACRESLDRAAGPNRHFYLTIACPAGSNNYTKLLLPQMTPLLDFYNLMSYDFAGSWDATSGHQANIFPNSANTSSTPFSIDAALNHYINVGGVPPSKIVVGMPLYGRAFQNTEGPGHTYSGVGEGSWENGVWDYKALPRPGANEFFDDSIGASWSYDKASRTMISYDTVAAGREKANFIRRRGLGGGMWWEASGDKGGPTGNISEGSLIGNFVDVIGGVDVLDQTANAVDYPESRYENIRSINLA
ncbi:hypothetical protein N7495_008009 [Penicillium taxi]|uniref:uncharacterized protein n=1 Tax=Penicillium taxi TaxID=168475 RepID=UPI0025455327|nr:uncharacterized protein N7495_008009 [Penicillium taxi]KAJ5887968.1 hypothetical protein N7495_008009 [Penicillium taxi]